MTDKETKFDRKYCEAIAKMSHNGEVPDECKEFASVITIIRRRDSTRSDHAIAFQGMAPGDMYAAMHAREKGHLNPTQIQRRMTHRHHTRVW